MTAEIEALLLQAGQRLGYGSDSLADVQGVFQLMSRCSLAHPSPWPSKQLSSLADGWPFELSVSCAEQASSKLRYAMEIGNPYLAAPARAASARSVLHSVSTELGLDPAWGRFDPAVERLLSERGTIPDGTRFVLWGGVEHARLEAGHIATTLKIYINLMELELGGAAKQVKLALEACGLPVTDAFDAVLRYLDRSGCPQELGFGVNQAGRAGYKVYFELPGWNEQTVAQVTRLAGLQIDPEHLIPEIPGILRRELAKKRRSGISLLMDAESGDVVSVTTTAAFPSAMLSPARTKERVERWLRAEGLNSSTYTALAELLLPGWRAHSTGLGQLHSLFTRSCTRSTWWVSIYLRPHLQSAWQKRAAEARRSISAMTPHDSLSSKSPSPK